MSKKMNPEVKRKWVEALRSGKYEQEKGRLRKLMEDGTERYCCLGVLCEIYKEDFNQQCETAPTDDGHEYLPGPEVQDWAGISGDGNPAVKGRGLASWNDDQNASFGEIADMIEAEL